MLEEVSKAEGKVIEIGHIICLRTQLGGRFDVRIPLILIYCYKVILFIDEIHTVIGAGGSAGHSAMDAGNLLKPMLARGELRCIGATTLNEYQKYIEKVCFSFISLTCFSIHGTEQVVVCPMTGRRIRTQVRAMVGSLKTIGAQAHDTTFFLLQVSAHLC